MTRIILWLVDQFLVCLPDWTQGVWVCSIVLNRAASHFRFEGVNSFLLCFSIGASSCTFSKVRLVDCLVEHWAGSERPVLSAELVFVNYRRSLGPSRIAELEGSGIHCFVSRQLYTRKIGQP